MCVDAASGCRAMLESGDSRPPLAMSFKISFCELRMLWQRLGFIVACVVLPILWGVVVHRVFELFRTRPRSDSDEHEPEFPDYQI
jgi:hypothetical protein